MTNDGVAHSSQPISMSTSGTALLIAATPAQVQRVCPIERCSSLDRPCSARRPRSSTDVRLRGMHTTIAHADEDGFPPFGAHPHSLRTRCLRADDVQAGEVYAEQHADDETTRDNHVEGGPVARR